MVRIFIGVDVPTLVINHAKHVQENLAALSFKGKFVEPENFHISISFIGDVETEKLQRMKSMLDSIIGGHKKPDAVIGKVILIPNPEFARVIALDVKSAPLDSIKKDIVDKIGGESHDLHLTLARVKSIGGKQKFIEGIKNLPVKESHIQIDCISIFQSVLQGKKGPMYSILHRSYFK